MTQLGLFDVAPAPAPPATPAHPEPSPAPPRKGFTISPVETGRGTYFMLLDPKGIPRAQGSRDLCESALATLVESAI